MTVSFPSEEEATLRYGQREVRVSLDDAKAMRELLLETLKSSKFGDKAVLVAATEPLPAWIDSDGRIMIAGWALRLAGEEFVASYQLARSAERAVGYAARFAKDEQGWHLLEIVPEKISFRR
jgi:hypothetical protein